MFQNHLVRSLAQPENRQWMQRTLVPVSKVGRNQDLGAEFALCYRVPLLAGLLPKKSQEIYLYLYLYLFQHRYLFIYI